MKLYKNFLTESKQGKTAIATYGRMNPPTIGHVKLAKKIQTEARRRKAEPYIFLSPSQNAKKDPLDPDRKVVYAEKTLGQHINIDVKPNIFKALSDLYSEGFKEVAIVVGSDRLNEFSKMIPKYNGVEGKAHGFYDFANIDFVSSGERDPDAEGVSGMSASKLRGFAVSGDFDNFKKGTKLSAKDSKSMFNEIRKAMKVESVTEQVGVRKVDFVDGVEEQGAEYPKTDADKKAHLQKIFKKMADVRKAKEKAMGVKITDVTPKGYGPNEDAKMGKQSDSTLKKLHKKFSSMDMSSPANKHMHKRIEKEMKKRGQVAFPSGIDEIAPVVAGAARLAVGAAKVKKIVKKVADRIGTTNNDDEQNEVAPPGREKQVKALKKKVGTDKAYAFAWAQHNKHGLPEEIDRKKFPTRKQIKKNWADTQIKRKKEMLKTSHPGYNESAIKEDHLKAGAKVKVAHPAKGKGMVTGKIVRYDNQGPGSPFYIVSIPGLARSEKVPAHKIKEEFDPLKLKAEQTGVPFKILEKVYKRGLSSWKIGHRAGTTAEQYAEARVNSFLTGGKTRLTADDDLWSNVSSNNSRIKEEMDTNHAFKKWLALSETDVVVDTPQGRYVKKGSVSKSKTDAQKRFTKAKDKKSVQSRIATPVERKYLQRKDEE